MQKGSTLKVMEEFNSQGKQTSFTSTVLELLDTPMYIHIPSNVCTWLKECLKWPHSLFFLYSDICHIWNCVTVNINITVSGTYCNKLFVLGTDVFEITARLIRTYISVYRNSRPPLVIA
jgi:hypothetical protein